MADASNVHGGGVGGGVRGWECAVGGEAECGELSDELLEEEGPEDTAARVSRVVAADEDRGDRWGVERGAAAGEEFA